MNIGDAAAAAALRSVAAGADAERMEVVGRFGSGRRRMPGVLVAVVLAVALTACGGGSSAKAGGTPSYTDPATPINVKVGTVFEVRLAANATTGYTWRVGQTVPALVKQAGARYIAPVTGHVGSGGTAVMRFRATSKGHGALGLAYVGPGTKPTTARTVTFMLNVT